jgi:hypothetical protein
MRMPKLPPLPDPPKLLWVSVLIEVQPGQHVRFGPRLAIGYRHATRVALQMTENDWWTSEGLKARVLLSSAGGKARSW